MKLCCIAFFTLLSLGISADSATKNLVEVAAGNPEFSTLVTALKAADLVDVVKNGTFTVLAPTNQAFENLPGNTLADLLKPENKAALQAVLTYHVIEGSVPLAGLLGAGGGSTVEGSSVEVAFSEGNVRVNTAVLAAADIRCANGIIHVIDSVLLPPEKGPKTLVETAQEAGTFTTLLAAAKAAGLVEALSGEGPLTVFAPTDEAFARVPSHTLDRLLRPENKQELANLLTYHVVKGRVTAGDALNAGTAAALNGQKISFTFEDGSLKAQGAGVRAIDVEAANGIIHVIDEVMMPPQNMSKLGNSEALRVIDQAIHRGVPLFNHGDPSACAAVYKQASQKLLANFDLPRSAREPLEHAMRASGHSCSANDKAWKLRHGLDAASAALMAMTPRG